MEVDYWNLFLGTEKEAWKQNKENSNANEDTTSLKR